MAYWSGGTNTNGSWSWDDSTEICTNNSCTNLYSNWFGQNPNNDFQSALSILMVNDICSSKTNYSHLLGTWQDEALDKKMNFICLKHVCKIFNPCQNGGLCNEHADGFSYNCLCLDGYFGINCTTDACSTNHTCTSDEECIFNPSFRNYTCIVPDYSGGDITPDPCSSEPCLFDGTCQSNGSDGHKCLCKNGTYGTNCNIVSFLGGSELSFYNEKMLNYQDAQHYCTERNSTLLMIKNETIQQSVNQLLTNIGPMIPCQNATWQMIYWIGGDNLTGSWLWNDGTEICLSNNCSGTYGNWFGSNPNGHCSQFALQMYKVDSICGNNNFTNLLGKWSDMEMNKSRNFICIKDGCTVSNPCKTGKTCIASEDGLSYNCSCPLGFTGTNCSLGPCSSSPCPNGTLCSAIGSLHECKCPEGYYGESCEKKTQKVALDPAWIAVIVLGACLFFVLLGIFVYAFKNRSKPTNDTCDQKETIKMSSISKMPQNLNSTKVSVANLLPYYYEMTNNNFNKLYRQFKKLDENEPQFSRKCSEISSIAEYASVPMSRTPNQPVQSIDLSYVDGYKMMNEYLVCSHIDKQCVEKFWDTIWNSNCKVVVLLSDELENRKMKFWPVHGEFKQLQQLTVECISETDHASYSVRILKLSMVENPTVTKAVTMLHFNWWQGPECPNSTSDFLAFYCKYIEVYRTVFDSSTTVICSDGCGRSGVFVCLDFLLTSIKYSNYLNVAETVKLLRRQRYGLVANARQYIFLHKLLVEFHCLGKTDFPKLKIATRMKELQLKSSNGVTGYETEFNKLDLIKPIHTSQGVAQLDENKSKNRIDAVLPYDKHLLQMPQEHPKSLFYYNASLFQNVKEGGSVIVAQYPYPEVVEDFWSLVSVCDVNLIVLLCGKEPCMHGVPDYWPRSAGQTTRYGKLSVSFNKQIPVNPSCVQRKFNIGSDKPSIVQLHFINWNEHNVPGSCESFWEFIQTVQRIHTNRGGTLLVQCSDGSNRCGLFLAALKLVQTAQSRTGNVDIFRTVKDLRDVRPGMVSSKRQYRFLHRFFISCLLETTC
uniref:protein-tyrosine-phosphatase n=1 Tax=Phallusia mammillata TaxID=59560 RepID=A0A6F9DHR3_9ASCI|nr:uncharacterized protein LOC100178651 [Phallusia mammillata]